MSVGGSRLRIALPWLDRAGLAAGPGAVARLPATEWLLARARRHDGPRDWRDWLLEDASLGPGLLQRFPAGPCVRAACTGERPAGAWACAAPVHLVTALDHLRLAAPAPLPLEAEESRELVSDLNRRLAGRGFTLCEADRGWLCACPDGIECTAPPPADALGGNLRELMPVGRDAGRVIAWVNELQMVLHEHPVNERREARGLVPVNSVWLWGFGAAGSARARAEGLLLTDDDWLAGLWRLHGAQPAAPERFEAALAGGAAMVRIGLGSAPDARTLSARLLALEQQLSHPVRAALTAGSVTGVSILGGAAVWELDPGSRWQYWRRPKPLAELLP